MSARVGRLVMDLVGDDLRPSRMLTRQALENAIAGVWPRAARPTGCCTSSPSPTKPASPLTIDDFDPVSDRIPLIADLKPGGKYVAIDLYRAGGRPLVARRLLEGRLLNGTPSRVRERRSPEEAAAASERPGQEVVRPLDAPSSPPGAS